jgi:hypothetical protein
MELLMSDCRSRFRAVSVVMRRVAAAGLALGAASAMAAETRQTYYAHGAQSVYAAFMPPPGKTQFYGYSLFYDASSIRDAAGDAIPGISAKALAAAPRILHTLERELFGFKVSFGVLALFINSSLDTPAGQAVDYGPTLWGIEPFYLSRSEGDWHFLFGPVLYFPWGHYDPNAGVNVMLNRIGGALSGAVTWTPTPRWDVSVTAGHEFKGRNRDTQYRDGQQLGITYGIAHRPFADMRWDFGLSGQYTVQLEDDRQSGQVIPNNRIRKFTIGPKVGYWFSQSTAVIFQWHKEYAVQNAPRGDSYWLMFSFPLGS